MKESADFSKCQGFVVYDAFVLILDGLSQICKTIYLAY